MMLAFALLRGLEWMIRVVSEGASFLDGSIAINYPTDNICTRPSWTSWVGQETNNVFA